MGPIYPLHTPLDSSIHNISVIFVDQLEFKDITIKNTIFVSETDETERTI